MTPITSKPAIRNPMPIYIIGSIMTSPAPPRTLIVTFDPTQKHRVRFQWRGPTPPQPHPRFLPIRRSPRGQRPLNRTILVLAAVSSTNTSRSHPTPSRPRHIRALLLRHAQAFFESDLVALEEAQPGCHCQEFCACASSKRPLSSHTCRRVRPFTKSGYDLSQEALPRCRRHRTSHVGRRSTFARPS